MGVARGVFAAVVATLVAASIALALVILKDKSDDRLNEDDSMSASSAGAQSSPPSLDPKGDKPSDDSELAEADVPDDARPARVIRHVDGDTLELEGSAATRPWFFGRTTVRLLEIDTPESVAPGTPVQCYAERATKALAELAPVGSQVWVLKDEELLDPYGRTLLYLWNEHGQFVNLELVLVGVARAVLFEPNDRFIAEMRRAESDAQRANRGLWEACARFGAPARFADAPSAPSSDAGTDPRFSTCEEALSAGYGDYDRRSDPEYDWYVDADAHGAVCER